MQTSGCLGERGDRAGSKGLSRKWGNSAGVMDTFINLMVAMVFMGVGMCCNLSISIPYTQMQFMSVTSH